MKLSDLRDWLKDCVSALNISQEVEYNIGRYLASNHNPNNILISASQLGGTNRPPFLRYNRYKVHIISSQIFMSPTDQDGDDIDYSEDDPMSQFGQTPTPIKPIFDFGIGAWEEGEAIADAIELASDGKPPCNATGIKLLSSKAGPLYLDDGRIYYTLDLEIII